MGSQHITYNLQKSEHVPNVILRRASDYHKINLQRIGTPGDLNLPLPSLGIKVEGIFYTFRDLFYFTILSISVTLFINYFHLGLP